MSQYRNNVEVKFIKTE